MNVQPKKWWAVVWPSRIVNPLVWMILTVSFLGGCNSPSTSQSFPDECAAIRASLAAAGGRELTVTALQRHDQSQESSASYEFGSGTNAAVEAVKAAFPKSYRLVREAPDELNYARTDGGDSVYVTVSFSTAPGGKTQARVLMKSLPS